MAYDPLSVVALESAAFAVAAQGDLDAPVVSCPDWRLRDLVRHLGTVQRFHALHLVRGVADPPQDRPPGHEGDVGLLGWFTQGTVVLMSALRARPLDAPAWNWAPHTPQVVGFWHRRMALEAAVHRWDAQSTWGTPLGFDLDVAVDGIDEVLTVQRPAELTEEPGSARGVVQVRLTDSDAGWTVELTPGAAALTQKTPDAVLEGTSTGVFLALWGRKPLSELQVDGDRELVAALRTG